ncbi:MAG: hypothetical protein C0507_02290 [Cyanobacteria bacterium PR.3.49]|nr:hypothetical protein [Cyanobacteria bacterium PR.3.49]
MNRLKAPSSGKKALMQLRLAVARATVRYALDTRGAHLDIPDAAEVSELCDEYALRALAIWLATACGSHICRSAMSKTNRHENNSLLSDVVRTNEYPFASPVSEELERELEAITRDHLSCGLAPSVELLGTLFELIANQSLDISLENGGKVGFDIQAKERRRIVGQFYTPPHVVKYCFDIAFREKLAELIKSLKPAKSQFKLLDPSSGTGNFLCGFLLYVRNAIEDERCQTAKLLYSLACNSIYGRELDPRAAALARLCVKFTCADAVGHLCSDEGENCRSLYEQLSEKLRRHILVSDSLLAASLLPKELQSTFDLVITNPPYVSFGARNQKTLLSTSARFLKTNYPQAAEYKVRYHSIFQDVAIRYARTGGSIVLLVPDGFLTGSYYRKLRLLLLSSCRIVSLSELPAKIMPEAVVGRWCVAHYKKQSNAESDYPVELATFIDERGSALDASIDLEAGKTYSLPISELHDKSNDTFRLVFNKEDHELLRLTDALPRLKSALNGYTGIRSLTGRNSITGRSQENQFWRRGITSGAQVRRFQVSWDGDWINVNPDLLFKGGFNERIVENPKILVRQTGDSLVCAYDDGGLYHLNNVHSFSPAAHVNSTQTNSFDMLSLCALMNSTLWKHIYRLRTRETGRALAQVDIDAVEALPLKHVSDELVVRISHLTRLLADLLLNASLKSSPDSAQKADDLILFIDRSIDRLVYDAYELDPQLVDRVEQVSAATGKRLPSSKEVQEFIEGNSW